MTFLIDNEKKVIIQTQTPEEAKNLVEVHKGVFEVVGVSNKRKLFLLYPEYKGYEYINLCDFRFYSRLIY